MQKWQQGADKDILNLSKKARHEFEVKDSKRKQKALEKVVKIVQGKKSETRGQMIKEGKLQDESKRLSSLILGDAAALHHQKHHMCRDVRHRTRHVMSTITPIGACQCDSESEEETNNLAQLYGEETPAPNAAPPTAPQAPEKPASTAATTAQPVTKPATCIPAPAEKAPKAGDDKKPKTDAADKKPKDSKTADEPNATDKPESAPTTVPTKPREANDLEQAIKDNEVKLRLMKPRNPDLLEADEIEKAEKLQRNPTSIAELVADEEEKITKQKEAIKKQIKKDQDRLDEIFPESARALIKEQKLKEANKALSSMATKGTEWS